MRVKNSNIKKGKSGGYRLIYLVESERKDITVDEINSIFAEFYGD